MKNRLISNNISLKNPKSEFSTKVIDGKDGRPIDRAFDTEAIILEDINYKLKNIENPSGKITLYTELVPCESCVGVINQFMEKFPNIDIDVFFDKYEN